MVRLGSIIRHCDFPGNSILNYLAGGRRPSVVFDDLKESLLLNIGDYVSKIKLNNVDLAWLRMENPTNPMMITVVLQFTGQINYDQLITTLKVHLARYRRFWQRVVRPQQLFSRAYWEDDPDYRVENHVERLDLPSPSDEAALQEFVNTKMSALLDFAHPLWKVTLIDNYLGGSVIIARMHHCIADGISLMQVLLQMTQTSNGEPAYKVLVENNGSVTHRRPAKLRIVPQVKELSTVSQISPAAPSGDNPGQTPAYRNPTFAEVIAATARIIFRSPDPPTILKRRLGKTKKAVWSESFSVAEIKEIAQYNESTINDVLMAIATGAIRRYIDLHKDKRKRNVRAFVMVNLRGRSFDEELGNKFGLVFLTLPIDRDKPLERLDGIKQGMDILKASAEYAASYLILKFLGQMPEWIEHLATRILDTKGTVVATNVPGPRHTIYLAGAPIQSIKAWVPQSGRIGVGLSFVSYNNQIGVGLNADAGLIPDPEKFLELFAEEFKSLQAGVTAVSPKVIEQSQSDRPGLDS